MKDEPELGFTAPASHCHSRAVLAGEVIMVNVNDNCIWVKASPSPLAVDASSVAMEMAPSAQLLLLIKIQVERDGERRKARGQTQLMSQAAWRRGRVQCYLFSFSEGQRVRGFIALMAAV